MVVPQGRQRRLHPGAGPGRRSRSGPRSGSSRRSSGSSRRTAGRPASRSPTAPSSTRRSSSPRSTRGGRSSSSSTRASCRPTSSSTIERFRFQGTSAKVNFALDGAAALPGPRRPDRPVPRVHQHRAVDGVPRAGLRRRQVRLVLEAAVPRLRRSSRWSIRTWRRPARHVMSCFVQYAPYHLRESDWDTEKENLGDTVQATLESFFPGLRRPRPPARGPDAARHRADGRACPRATSSPASSSRRRCSSSGPRPAGRSTGPRSTATTSAAPARTRAAASWARRASSPRGQILKDRERVAVRV